MSWGGEGGDEVMRNMPDDEWLNKPTGRKKLMNILEFSSFAIIPEVTVLTQYVPKIHRHPTVIFYYIFLILLTNRKVTLCN